MPNRTLDPTLLAVLACPDVDHAPLRPYADGDSLVCTACGRVYPIDNGIPVLLLDRACPFDGGGGGGGGA